MLNNESALGARNRDKRQEKRDRLVMSGSSSAFFGRRRAPDTNPPRRLRARRDHAWQGASRAAQQIDDTRKRERCVARTALSSDDFILFMCIANKPTAIRSQARRESAGRRSSHRATMLSFPFRIGSLKSSDPIQSLDDGLAVVGVGLGGCSRLARNACIGNGNQ